VTSICCNSGEGGIVVTAGKDGKVKIWEDEGEQNFGEMISLCSHDSPVNHVVLSASGAFMFSCGMDGNVIVWDYREADQIAKFNASSSVSSVTRSHDDRYIFTASSDGKVKLWNTLGAEKASSEDFTNLCAVACTVDALVVITETTVYRQTYQKLRETFLQDAEVLYNVKKQKITATALSPDFSIIAIGKSSGKVSFALIEGKAVIQTFRVEGEIIDLQFSPYSYELCAITSNSLVIWNLESKEIVHSYTMDNCQFTCVAWANSRNFFVGCSDGNIVTLRVIERATNKSARK